MEYCGTQRPYVICSISGTFFCRKACPEVAQDKALLADGNPRQSDAIVDISLSVYVHEGCSNVMEELPCQPFCAVSGCAVRLSLRMIWKYQQILTQFYRLDYLRNIE